METNFNETFPDRKTGRKRDLWVYQLTFTPPVYARQFLLFFRKVFRATAPSGKSVALKQISLTRKDPVGVKIE